VTRRSRVAPSAQSQPLVVNSWSLYIWTDLAERWNSLRAEVERLRQRDPQGSVHSPAAKMLKMMAAVMLKEIPADPNSKRYWLGHSLGGQFASWRRAKFLGRFRLFFRFHTKRRAIVYAWLNDELTLRKAGARTDPYAVFARMLASGSPPDDFDDLLRASGALKQQ
jgi:toxin YhaV